MRAFADARLAALKAGLALTPDQEKNWPAFEEAARELAKLRLDRMSAQRERIADRREARRNAEQQQQGRRDPIDRLRQRGTTMAETGTALRKLADATDPLYNSLDDSQKRRFAVLSRIGGGRYGRPGFFRHHHGERHMHRHGDRRSELREQRDHRWHFGADRDTRRQRGKPTGRESNPNVENL
jgi:hypothetical protein